MKSRDDLRKNAWNISAIRHKSCIYRIQNSEVSSSAILFSVSAIVLTKWRPVHITDITLRSVTRCSGYKYRSKSVIIIRRGEKPSWYDIILYLCNTKHIIRLCKRMEARSRLNMQKSNLNNESLMIPLHGSPPLPSKVVRWMSKKRTQRWWHPPYLTFIRP